MHPGIRAEGFTRPVQRFSGVHERRGKRLKLSDPQFDRPHPARLARVAANPRLNGTYPAKVRRVLPRSESAATSVDLATALTAVEVDSPLPVRNTSRNRRSVEHESTSLRHPLLVAPLREWNEDGTRAVIVGKAFSN